MLVIAFQNTEIIAAKLQGAMAAMLDMEQQLRVPLLITHSRLQQEVMVNNLQQHHRDMGSRLQHHHRPHMQDINNHSSNNNLQLLDMGKQLQQHHQLEGLRVDMVVQHHMDSSKVFILTTLQINLLISESIWYGKSCQYSVI